MSEHTDHRPTTTALRERIDWMVDEDPLKLRDALYAVLNRLDAESAGAARQMAQGDYRLCPPDMLRVYCHEAIWAVLGAGADQPVTAVADGLVRDDQ